jgi:hypothetical protein
MSRDHLMPEDVPGYWNEDFTGGYCCRGCGEREAVCDDYCVECRAEFYINDDDSIEVDESVWPDLFKAPYWRDVKALVLADKERP